MPIGPPARSNSATPSRDAEGAIHSTSEFSSSFDADIWTAYEDVYAASWKPAEGSLSFLRALGEQEAAAGTLRLGVARDATGRAVAAQLWLVENGVATIHKLAHREDAKAGSPGSLLSHAMFRAAIADDRVRRIDFGLGDEPYKADWVDTPEPGLADRPLPPCQPARACRHRARDRRAGLPAVVRSTRRRGNRRKVE